MEPHQSQLVTNLANFSNCFISLALCLLLSVTYVLSLHIWTATGDRDHPSTIKRRFFSVFIMMPVSPIFVYLGTSKEILAKVTMWELLGIRSPGLCQAFVMPLFLTMILFLGPIAMKLNNGVWKLYSEPTYWSTNFRDLIWLRNHFVAPLSEEFTFRCCMLPLLLQSYAPITAVMVCPLFFGVAHLHHMKERIKLGLDFRKALYIGCFQLVYTTIFGMYSAYLLLRTGHFAATFVVHSFCNHMGFPDFAEVGTYQGRQKVVVIGLFLTGFILWCFLLNPLTEPSWYHNNNNNSIYR